MSTVRTPQYCRHRASGQAVVRIDGRDHYLGTFETKASRAKYHQLIAEWESRGRQSPQPASAEISIAQLIAAYWRHAKRHYRLADGSESTELSVLRLTLRALHELYAELPALEFSPLKLVAVQSSMVRKGWARRSINKHVSRIRNVFKWAISQELLPKDTRLGLETVAGLKAGRTEAHDPEPVKPVPAAWVYETLNHAGEQIAAMIRLQLLTGMRPGEVLRMRGVEIDTTGEQWIYKPEHHKTKHHGHTRAIYLGQQARQVLAPFMKIDLSAYVFSPIEAEQQRREQRHAGRKTPLSCGNKPGSNRKQKPKRAAQQRYTVASYRRAIARACDVAFPPPGHLARGRVQSSAKRSRRETPAEWKSRLGPSAWAELRKWQREHRWHPHQLRHTAATELRKRFGVEAAQIVLGHRNINVTELYAEKNAEAAKRIAAEVG